MYGSEIIGLSIMLVVVLIGFGLLKIFEWIKPFEDVKSSMSGIEFVEDVADASRFSTDSDSDVYIINMDGEVEKI